MRNGVLELIGDVAPLVEGEDLRVVERHGGGGLSSGDFAGCWVYSHPRGAADCLGRSEQ